MSDSKVIAYLRANRQRHAIEIAVGRGADVDQPRNLAKSVTVE